MITRRDFIVTSAATASSPLAVHAANEIDVRLPLNSPNFGRARDHRRRSGQKTLDQEAQSGDLHGYRRANWGISDEPVQKLVAVNWLDNNIDSCIFWLW